MSNGPNHDALEIEIIRNYMPEVEFIELIKLVDKLPWFLGKKMNPNSSKENHFAFIQNYSSGHFRDSFDRLEETVFNSVIRPYCAKHEISARLHRVRTNLYIKVVEYHDGGGMHQDDISADCLTLLLYLEDSDGATEFLRTGERIISERNKAIIFPSNEFHQTISHTNVLYRMNLNVNFFKD